MATYVVSDLHGQYEAFEAGLKKIEFSDQDELYVLGDAIDRGNGGIRILQYVKQEKNMDLIIGNHEFMMLNSVDPNGKPKCSGQDDVLWLYYNGGNATFAEYKKFTPRPESRSYSG
ncbi:MAG: fructose-bisphosphatase class III [Lachnospiraceae bacterium]|nr:fructose-bisphosphatase class III [Lachnospiraceae bacterium]